MLRKIVFNIIFFLFASLAPITAQSYTDAEYETLLDDHEETLNDYEILLGEYEDLLKQYGDLSNDYAVMIDQFVTLNDTYLAEIGYHEGSKTALLASKRIIVDLEDSVIDLLSITDTRYMALYIQGGYSGDMVTAGVAFTARIPKVPVSFMIDVDYLHGLNFPINFQVGLGFRF